MAIIVDHNSVPSWLWCAKVATLLVAELYHTTWKLLVLPVLFSLISAIASFLYEHPRRNRGWTIEETKISLVETKKHIVVAMVLVWVMKWTPRPSWSPSILSFIETLPLPRDCVQASNQVVIRNGPSKCHENLLGPSISPYFLSSQRYLEHPRNEVQSSLWSSCPHPSTSCP